MLNIIILFKNCIKVSYVIHENFSNVIKNQNSNLKNFNDVFLKFENVQHCFLIKRN